MCPTVTRSGPRFAAIFAKTRGTMRARPASPLGYRRSWRCSMRSPKALLLVSMALLAASEARDAAACGGCFVQQTESTQVTGHKMILSISKDRTTLWDQIQYDGEPSSFAWVLPIRG